MTIRDSALIPVNAAAGLAGSEKSAMLEILQDWLYFVIGLFHRGVRTTMGRLLRACSGGLQRIEPGEFGGHAHFNHHLLCPGYHSK